MPSPTRPKLFGALVALSVFVMLYSLVIARQILLGLLVVAAIWLFYLCYRLLVRLGRIASALERIADAAEDETREGGH